MKYLLMIYFNQETFDSLSEEERQGVFQGHMDFMNSLNESGELIDNVALADPSHSVTVRVRNSVPAITDGPYVESKEYLAGYYMVDCETKERAAELAAMIPDARFSTLEVRPLMSTDGADVG
ncbi:MAG TPA: YciI family protein [Pseudonocardiaceae bacterium]|nr:YciI family protein [Pseudonocardiaceae bacterium]